MKLREIFDPAYYDELQHQVARHRKAKPKGTPDYAGRIPDSATTEQDFIITQYERELITYAEARDRIIETSPKGEAFFWLIELEAARYMKGH